MARPSNTDRRRAEIVNGLRQVMAARGYDGASVSAIAGAAGLTPGLVHYHFEDKREILLALLGDLAREATERAQRASARAGDDPLRRLEAYLDAFLSREADPDPAAVACWVAIAAEAIRQPRVRRAFNSALAEAAGALQTLVTAALEARKRDAREARAVAAALLAAVHGYFLISATAPEVVPIGSAAPTGKRLARMLVEGVGG